MKGRERSGKALKFPVRWSPVNGTESVGKWSTYAELKNTTARYLYSIKHRIRSLIPAEYKRYYSAITLIERGGSAPR